MPVHVTAAEARKLRHARNVIRKYERRLAAAPDKAPIIRERYERACALLVAYRLSGKLVRHDRLSQPQPVLQDL